MHLLAAKPGTISDGREAVDLGQTPGDIVYLSAADTELACLAQAQARRDPAAPTLRLANLLFLAHNLSVDRYVDSVIVHARLVIVRLLGGVRYWPYGVEQLAHICRARRIPLAFLPGDDQPDPELAERSTLPADAVHRLWQYGAQGGIENALNLLAYAATLIGREAEWREPVALLRAGLYWPGKDRPSLENLRREWRAEAPVAPIVFYRALAQSGDLTVVDAMIDALRGEGLNPLPVYAASLKDGVSADLLAHLIASAPPAVILNTTAFALGQPGALREATLFDAADCPVLQVVFASGDEEGWRDGTQGLSARDIAMHVALPEVDGRLLSRAVSFKAEAQRDERTQCAIVTYRPVADRVAFVAKLAAAWARLRATTVAERRVALVLANYPNRDGRIGNGVGLDTPAGTVEALKALGAAGYDVDGAPESGAGLMDVLLGGVTNNTVDRSERLTPLPLRERGSMIVPVGLNYRSQHMPNSSPHSPRPSATRSQPNGARRKRTRSSPTARSGCPHTASATSSSASSRRGGTTSIRRRPIIRRISCRPTAIWRSMPGCGESSAPMPSCIWASMAIWNGCRARRWRCRPIVRRKRCWGRCPISIPSSSTIPARAARRNAAPPPSSSIT